MTTLYKLTDVNGYTRAGCANACLWGDNITHSGTGEGDLCGPGYIHAYTSPELALLLNPTHANIKNPRLWIGKGVVAKNDRGLKVGCVKFTTLHEMNYDVISNNQKIYFAILCGMQVYKDKSWLTWANNWIMNIDRTADATAYAAYAAPAYAAYAAPAYAAYAAAAPAYAAAYAAAAAAAAAPPINFKRLAFRAANWKG